MAVSGVAPISYAEIDAWSRLTGTELFPIEIETITLLDRWYCDAARKAAG